MSTQRSTRLLAATTLFAGSWLLCGPGLAAAQAAELVANATTAGQPTATLQPGQDLLFSTAIFGDTSFCAANTSRAAGRMFIASWGGAGGGPTIDVPAGTTKCHTGAYWGVPAKVINTGSAPLNVTVTP